MALKPPALSRKKKPPGGVGDRSGRRAKFKPADVAEAIRKSRGFYTFAAELMKRRTGRNCVPNTIKNYVDRYSECRQAYEETQQINGDMIENKIIDRCLEGSDTMLIWYSRTKLRDRGYGHNTIEVSGQIQHDHEHHVRIEMLREDLLLEAERHATAPTAPFMGLPKVTTNGHARGNGGSGTGTGSD
ncbi:MAG: hypothetical protein ACREX3_17755 [Gammaproteobacteria bacterium]